LQQWFRPAAMKSHDERAGKALSEIWLLNAAFAAGSRSLTTLQQALWAEQLVVLPGGNHICCCHLSSGLCCSCMSFPYPPFFWSSTLSLARRSQPPQCYTTNHSTSYTPKLLRNTAEAKMRTPVHRDSLPFPPLASSSTSPSTTIRHTWYQKKQTFFSQK
jgi:hypothetical protein